MNVCVREQRVTMWVWVGMCMDLSTLMYGEEASYGDGSKHGDSAFLERIKRLRRYVFCSLGREGADVGRRGCNRWVRGMF